MPGRAAVWPQKHLWAPCAWVHTTDVAQVGKGFLARVWGWRAKSGLSPSSHMDAQKSGMEEHRAALTTGAIELLGNVFLACAGMVQQLAFTRVIGTITATHGALWGPMAGNWAQACGCLPISRAGTGAAEAAGHIGAGVPEPCGWQHGVTYCPTPLCCIHQHTSTHSPQGPRRSRRMRRCRTHCARCNSHSLL